MKVLVIIPAYNEEKNIKGVVEKLKEECPQYDYLIVNDGSKDNTVEVCKKNQYPYLDLPVNLGIGGAVQAGYLYAKKNGYEIAVQMDGDGQHNPEYIENLILPILNNEADMVIGSRFMNKEGFQSSLLRRIGINILRYVIKICCGITILDTTSGFRASSEKLTNVFAENYAQDYPEPEAIVFAALSGYRVKEIPVLMNEREEGYSSIYGLKSLYYMIKVSLALFVCKFSYKKR